MPILVCDVGGTFTKYALMTEEAEILQKGKVRSAIASKKAFVQSLEGILEPYKEDVEGLALSLPGIMDSERGFMFSGGSLAFVDNWAIAEELQARFGISVSIENDGNSAALAEHWKGVIQSVSNAAVVVLGTGVGGGVIINDKLLRGKNFLAGEFSLMASHWEEDFQLEDVLGLKVSVPKMVLEASQELGLTEDEATGEYLFSLAQAGNTIALAHLRRFSNQVARLIFTLYFSFNPEVFAIGGGISQQPLLLELINEQVEKLFQQLPGRLPRPNIQACDFYNEANLIGALYHYLSLKNKK